jgi:hypothetical protein
MRLYRWALVLALAACGSSIVACGPGDSGAAVDAAPGDDGSADDGTGDDRDLDVALFDVAARVDGGFGDAAPMDGALDSSPANDAYGVSRDGAVDATLGTVVVTADASLKSTTLGGPCAAANSLVVEPNQTHVGGTVRLTASGIDSANQSSDVALTWAATGTAGSLTSTTGTSNTFTCASAGTVSVTVTAAISEGGASCAAIGSLTATLVCSAS